MAPPPFKEMFQPGEVLLVYFQQQPSFFMRVEKVEADIKKYWWHLHFITLTIPIEPVTWILDDDQMRGASFTMDGQPIHIERVGSEIPNSSGGRTEPPPPDTTRDAQVISMFDEDV
jgi:hypothetical protein